MTTIYVAETHSCWHCLQYMLCWGVYLLILTVNTMGMKHLKRTV